MTAMRFEQVQRFILAKKKSGGLGALKTLHNHYNLLKNVYY